MTDQTLTAEFRAFNRFFTRLIGLLDEHLLASEFGLTEARAMYEIGHGNARTSRELQAVLGIDKGYLSRIVNRFERTGLIERVPAAHDRREREIRLSTSGIAAFDALQRNSNNQVGELVGDGSDLKTDLLLSGIRSIRASLDPDWRSEAELLIRPYRSGDLGWVVERHGLLYAQEYDWNIEFEALVAEIVAAFVRAFVPGQEQCWIAELGGLRAGSVMCIRVSDDVAKLRLLLVEPFARGKGVGKALVEQCIAFAIESGYREMELWTNDVLVEARSIYEKRGFVLESSEPHHSFGHDLISQTWRMSLNS